MPETGQRALGAGGGDIQPPLLRFADDGLGQRMAGALLHRGGQRQQVVLIDVGGDDRCAHARLADGQGAGFIKGDLANLAQLFKRGRRL
ncbi:Uncharacterised protein [Raoultella terrigena]|uniref:Uncharacterized protein n=1 Tax=Raoultella terrigena TaxID=577 RepID=A0A3P8JLA2_RAOTE|nr:Uncharacterised protein [Raoultella terrigena]